MRSSICIDSDTPPHSYHQMWGGYGTQQDYLVNRADKKIEGPSGQKIARKSRNGRGGGVGAEGMVTKGANWRSPETKYKRPKIAFAVTCIVLSLGRSGPRLLGLAVQSLIGSPAPSLEKENPVFWHGTGQRPWRRGFVRNEHAGLGFGRNEHANSVESSLPYIVRLRLWPKIPTQYSETCDWLSPEIPTQINWNLRIQPSTFWCIEVSSNPLHRYEFGPPKFFSKTFQSFTIFYSTWQISGEGQWRKACRSREKE